MKIHFSVYAKYMKIPCEEIFQNAFLDKNAKTQSEIEMEYARKKLNLCGEAQEVERYQNFFKAKRNTPNCIMLIEDKREKTMQALTWYLVLTIKLKRGKQIMKMLSKKNKARVKLWIEE